ncbi:unnamed protein product [Arabidopsis arenosa]|uniref:Uncharacterized protein n=1 Tax=Arabidopsis arenosa TaxID=38785 RepID=A0A8S2ALW2_ARAAE|nr:unnamed protein product [Arabidopsis arenosa]
MTVKRFSRRDGGSSNDGNEQFGAVEQESFINNSSEIRKDLVAGGGIEAIVNRLSKWVVSALFGSIILLRHDGAALWAVIGSISNSALSVVLKRILNQERPATTLRSDPGMPSSHAQSISFISVFAVLSVMEWLGTNGVSLFLSGLILALDTVKGFSETTHKQSSGGGCHCWFCFLHLVVHNVELTSS